MKTFKDFCINEQQQNQLKENYLVSNYALINANRPAGNPDSLHYSYDLSILMDYLDYVKAESQKLGLKNVKIRINMGKYPEQNFDSRLNPNFLNHQTIFITAVREDESGKEHIVSSIDSLDFAELCPPSCK